MSAILAGYGVAHIMVYVTRRKETTRNVADNKALYLGLSGDVILQIKRAEKVLNRLINERWMIIRLNTLRR